ncbi:virulence factor TspB C-terminal domain-related protein [Nitrosomonas sp. Nm166]|uniref:virulence factor TspB C-terminal domain-related protein n=1 Tax=Nitrosomonas sp. Nm166 TaxID=1881054 RepID=UPI0035268A54
MSHSLFVHEPKSTVPDEQIEQQDVDADLETPESWGAGFYPVDETINYRYGMLTFDFQPTCDFAIELKPVLLFIASLSAMFIISGVKVE